MVVNLSDAARTPTKETIERFTSLPFIVVGLSPAEPDDGWADLCDVVVPEDDPVLDDHHGEPRGHPIAATTLALLLRGQERRTLDDGLVAESSAYSVLQSGPEFRAWQVG